MKSTAQYKPEGYPSVSPYLIVQDADAAIRFIVEVFEAAEIRRFPDPSGGRLMHAEVRLGDSVVMIADSVEAWPPAPANVHVYVPDADRAYARALQAGATSLQEPAQKGDEDKRGGFEDAWKSRWWVATCVGASKGQANER